MFCRGKNDVKYLKIDKGVGNLSDSILNKWNQVFSAIKYHISDFDKIKFITDDSLPLGKQGDLVYPPVYLDDVL